MLPLPCRRYGRGGCAEGTAIVGNAGFNLGEVQPGENQQIRERASEMLGRDSRYRRRG